MSQKTALIIGAGPAGLTAAYELLTKTDIKPIIFEATSDIGGISKTVNYKGNRIDIGGHRFFSKSDRVMKFWLDIMPLQTSPSSDDIKLGREISNLHDLVLEYQNSKTSVPNSNDTSEHDPQKEDNVMLLRERLSRILFMRCFFDYPISLTIKTVCNLGIFRTFKIGLSYLMAKVFKIKHEKSLEDFLINRFGKELYNTFFKDYTEKVWGVSCEEIPPEWGAQRIKGLSITRAIKHAIKAAFTKDASIGQKEVETSLISQFLYPKYGPGQLWETLAEDIKVRGGQINLNHKVVGLNHMDNAVKSLTVQDEKASATQIIEGDYIISTMPVRDLVDSASPTVPQDVKKVSEGLMYRDFITVGLLLSKLKIKNDTDAKTVNGIVPDNWIYIQENDVKIGRLQVFNNWSPYMVADENTAWIGLEYFCNEGDELWSKPAEEFKAFAIEELVKIGVIDPDDVIDGCVIKMPKTYPAYFGTYNKFDVVRQWTDQFENLFLIGRNGMHRYNNMDHSMLTAMTAVENIIAGRKDKANIWEVNTEEEYHEAKMPAVENLTKAYTIERK